MVFFLFTTDSGHIYSFGSNSEGQLGIKDVSDLHLPKCIESLESAEYKMLAAGSDSSVALTGIKCELFILRIRSFSFVCIHKIVGDNILQLAITQNEIFCAKACQRSR